MRMNTMLVSESVPYDKHILIGIYEQHSPGLYRYAYRFLGDRHLAEECVAETFSRFLKALRNGGGPRDNVQAYLYRMAHNWVTDNYRRQIAPALSLEVQEPVDEDSNPDQIVARQMERDRVRAALLKLPSDQRRVIVLRLLEDWSHEEVATLLGKTTEATRALQYRALAALRRMLIDQEEGNL